MEYQDSVKKYKIEQTSFPIIRKAVNDLVDFVKPTFGPSQNKILIADEFHSDMLDDGIKIAEEFGSEDLLENAVIDFIKSSARQTNKRVGDGTTGCLILLQGIIKEIPDIFDSLAIIKELKRGLSEAKEMILEKKQEITTKEELIAAAEVSCNDPKIAAIIGELVHAVGQDGTVAIHDGSDLETTHELTEGMQFERGAVSRHMFPSQDKMEITLKNPKVLLFDRKLGYKEIRPILEKLIRLPEEEREMLLLADDFDEELATSLGQFRMAGTFNCVAVKSPAYGPNKIEQLKDLAALLGTEILDQNTKISEFDLNKAGSAKSITITQNTTLILGGAGDLTQRLEQIKAIKSDSAFDQEKQKERIARLAGKVAVIKIGGLTDEEIIATHEKVDDAVNATRAAYRGGVVPGAGITLSKIETSSPILNKALRAPLNTLLHNYDGAPINEDVIRDPVEVLIAQLESAVSIALLLISNKGIIVSYRERSK